MPKETECSEGKEFEYDPTFEEVETVIIPFERTNQNSNSLII